MNSFCDIGSDFKGRYKKRAINAFVTATEKIMEEEGINKVTIRKVSDLAGYSSATIYSYFENIDHLILFSSMRFLDAYIQAIPEYIKDETTSIGVFKKVWECFAHHAFQRADIFNTLFFSKLEDRPEDHMTEYYCIYPIKDQDYPEPIQRMLRETTIYERNMILINEAIGEGYITEKNRDEISDMTIFIFESILHRVCMGEILPEEAEIKMKKYLDRILDIEMCVSNAK
ncbi:MAG: TetR/AcrR family transcriptional regulator [Peptostreptococcaceae bacterium]|nr:TetR/AcrR family transcriptional regulator [Peptostreptococcaceae bacterium]